MEAKGINHAWVNRVLITVAEKQREKEQNDKSEDKDMEMEENQEKLNNKEEARETKLDKTSVKRKPGQDKGFGLKQVNY